MNHDNPTLCPKCKQDELIAAYDIETAKWVYVCENPLCYYEEPMPVDQQLRRQGAKGLPGMEGK